MSELDILKLVSSRLNDADVDYMLSGSVALTFYGKPRMTRDIDIVIVIPPQEIDRFVKIFEQDFYIDRDMVEDAVRNQSMFNIIHLETVIKVDFIIRKNQEYRILEFSKRKKMQLEEQEVSVVSLEDLIISKIYWAKDSFSEMQIKDIVSLLDLDVDMVYVQDWCARLGLDLILRKVLDERHK
ncbi:MAG TPA: nucleotidyl transferase AbiEii/AbiGii toxin family protein [Candidatus Kapabacteria bacterium]|nr:nucleotidyl transferase AbiEii/AbiGii toxin family protein [Candidatus Kapabacteria bacterium]